MKRLCGWIFLFGLCSFSVGAVEISGGDMPESGSNVASPDYSDTLLGDWGGSRGAMSVQGYDWEITYTLDLLRDISAPNKKSYALDNLDIMLTLDGEKIIGLKGSSALLYVLSNHGSKPAVQGDRLPHGVDNIETPEGANTVKLYQAWLQQTFFDESLSVLVGLYDLNSEFYVTEASSMFIQPTFGIGAEMAATGQNGPSVFPVASFAIRAKSETDSGYYLQAAAMDGVSGDPNNYQGTHVQFNKGDGTLNVIEAGVPLGIAERSHNSKLALGIWRYTARFDDLLDSTVKRISRGYYAMVEKGLHYKPDSNEACINGFVRAGKNDGDTSQFEMSWSAGLVFSNLISGRDQDQLGFAFAQQRNAEKYRATPGNSQVINENSLELTYRYHAMQGLVLQPMVQYLLNHSSDPTQDKSWWLGTRIEAAF